MWQEGQFNVQASVFVFQVHKRNCLVSISKLFFIYSAVFYISYLGPQSITLILIKSISFFLYNRQKDAKLKKNYVLNIILRQLFFLLKLHGINRRYCHKFIFYSDGAVDYLCEENFFQFKNWIDKYLYCANLFTYFLLYTYYLKILLDIIYSH